MAERHIHKYMRKQMKFQDKWICALGCGHYLPKNVEEMIEGAKSICWNCGKEFRIDEDAINECLDTMDSGIGILKCWTCREIVYDEEAR